MPPAHSFVRMHISVVKHALVVPALPRYVLSLPRVRLARRACFYLLVLCAREADNGRGKKNVKKKKNRWKAIHTGNYWTIINLMTLLCCIDRPKFSMLNYSGVYNVRALWWIRVISLNITTNFTGIYRA